ncbi:MAG: restriction endonuclease subunit S [Goleter apudmare HA4340-LM2]|jgi:type I restriction enzyme S subunit|nr:restriction endonuclease subunit S [Goleter apudmare HA4340-LM2]
MKTQWIKTTLSSCVKLQSGGTPSKNNPDYWGGDIPWVSSKDFKSIRIYDTEDHITDLAVENGAKLVPPGTILLAVRGMRLAKELPLVEIQCTASFNQDLKALHCTELITPRFLLYWLLASSHQLMGKCDEAAHGTKRLQTQLLLSTPIELPPLTTQQRIAEILSTYDRLIDNNNRRIALLEQSIHLLYKEWFVHLRFPGYESVRGATRFCEVRQKRCDR